MKTTLILDDKREEDIKKAAELISQGKLVAFPTETVYGLGADATNADACRNIFIAKGRPQDNPLIVHVASVDDVDKYAYTNDLFNKIAKRFMPGALTVILPKKESIPNDVTAGLDSVAIRVPAHPTTNMLIRLAGKPIAAPSANISGKPSPTTAQHVINDMDGRIEAILCGEKSNVGVESTVIKITDNSIIICRPGEITPEMLRSVCDDITIDPAVLHKFKGKPISPGMKYRHYAPNAPVTVLDGTEEQIARYLSHKENFGILCFAEDKQLLTLENAYSIGAKDDSRAQAQALFEALRLFDEKKELQHIYARMPQKDGLGLAVFNRLIKAAGFSIISLDYQ